MNKYVITIGVFDGVHIGHQALFEYIKKLSKERNLLSKAYVVSHPFEVFSENFDGLITSLKMRIGNILVYVDEVEVLDLLRIKDMNPDQFFESYILNQANVVVVGKDFRFGKRAVGTVETLRELCNKSGIEFFSFDPVKNETVGKVSSSEIRQLIKLGQIEKVERLLGRKFSLEVIVEDENHEENTFRVKQLDGIVRLGFGKYNVEEYNTAQKGMLIVEESLKLNLGRKLLINSIIVLKILSKAD